VKAEKVASLQMRISGKGLLCAVFISTIQGKGEG
jgi:hypothetical protein